MFRITFKLLIILSFTCSLFGEQPEIAKVEAYLNNISTMTAKFTQIAPDGNISEGNFYLSRPGKLRWEYNPPMPVLIIINGSLLMYYDADLDEYSYVNSYSHLTGFLTKKSISFDSKDIILKEYIHKAGLIKITIEEKGKKEFGGLTLIFSDNPIAFKKLEIIDNNNQVTELTLTNVQYGISLKSELFKILYK